MKFASIVCALFMAGNAVATNPFEAKMSANNKKAAAQANYVNKLVRGAKATANSQLGRRLDEEAEEYEIDISQYSVKFQQCQFVKAYDDDMAADEDSGTPLATKRFVIFRLCPSGSCGSCSYGYGEYLIDLETYLQSAVGYQQEIQEDMCEQCGENCANDDNQEQDGDRRKLKKKRRLEVDCDSCVEECEKIEDMEDNGYIEASNFLECEMIYDPEDDITQAYYAGPICSSGGTKIKIGVFEDEYCNSADSSKNVDDYLVDENGYTMKLSHALLKQTYDADACISCEAVEEEEGEDENDGDNEEEEENEVEVTEMCQELYDEAAKCEKTHGFDDGYSNYDGYSNQLANEEVVCDFIGSLKGGTYDEDGEIKIGGRSSSSSSSSTTGGQKFALTFFTLGTVGLAVYAAMLHTKLTKGGKAELSQQGGALA